MYLNVCLVTDDKPGPMVNNRIITRERVQYNGHLILET